MMYLLLQSLISQVHLLIFNSDQHEVILKHNQKSCNESEPRTPSESRIHLAAVSYRTSWSIAPYIFVYEVSLVYYLDD